MGCGCFRRAVAVCKLANIQLGVVLSHCAFRISTNFELYRTPKSLFRPSLRTRGQLISRESQDAVYKTLATWCIPPLPGHESAEGLNAVCHYCGITNSAEKIPRDYRYTATRGWGVDKRHRDAGNHAPWKSTRKRVFPDTWWYGAGNCAQREEYRRNKKHGVPGKFISFEIWALHQWGRVASSKP